MATFTYTSGTRNTLNGTSFADTITVRGTAKFNFNVLGNAGNDRITISENAVVDYAVAGGSGNDDIFISGNASIGADYTGWGTGVYTGTLAVGNGAGSVNTVTVTGSPYISNIYGDEGQDTFLINGTNVRIGYWVTGNGGNDVITVSGTATIGVVEGDGGNSVTDGNDIITISSGSTVKLHGIQGGGGNDTIKVYGSGYTYSTTGKFGYFTGEILGQAGTDSITVGETFTVNGDVDGGSGNDTIVIKGSATVNADVVGGTGDDSITIQNSADVNGTIFGGDGADTIVISSGSGNFTVDGGSGGTDNDSLDLSALIAIHGSPTSIVETTDADGNSTSGSVTFTNGTVITFSEIESMVVCFTAGTRIETIEGHVSIDTIEVGDLVRTADNGYQPVRWIGRRTISGEKLRAHPNLYPIRIRAGAIAKNLPEQDLLVSPQHRILVKSKIAERMFGADEVLVAAKHLTALEGVDVAMDVDQVTYVHFMCAQHEVVYSEGLPTETLYTGQQALSSLHPEARGEIFSIFPELLDGNLQKVSAPARLLVNGRRGRQLAQRHTVNQKPLLHVSKVQIAPYAGVQA